MLIVLTAEIAAGVWAYQNSDKLESFVKSNFKHTIQNEYKVIETRTEIVDLIQENFQCCGAENSKDWISSKYNNPKSGVSDLTISGPKLSYAVPKSCCKNGTEKSICETSRKTAINTNFSSVINNDVS